MKHITALKQLWLLCLKFTGQLSSRYREYWITWCTCISAGYELKSARIFSSTSVAYTLPDYINKKLRNQNLTVKNTPWKIANLHSLIIIVRDWQVGLYGQICLDNNWLLCYVARLKQHCVLSVTVIKKLLTYLLTLWKDAVQINLYGPAKQGSTVTVMQQHLYSVELKTIKKTFKKRPTCGLYKFIWIPKKKALEKRTNFETV